jgi:hypothetical protein
MKLTKGFNMRFAALLLVVVSITGCGFVGLARDRLTVKRWHDENKQNDSKYRQMLGEHAEERTLLGTWTITTTSSTKFEYKPLTELSLFSDGTYAMRRESMGTQIHFVAIRVQEGSWVNVAPGIIEITPSEPKSITEREAQAVDLTEWTNVFVQANNQIHEFEGD